MAKEAKWTTIWLGGDHVVTSWRFEDALKSFQDAKLGVIEPIQVFEGKNGRVSAFDWDKVTSISKNFTGY